MRFIPKLPNLLAQRSYWIEITLVVLLGGLLIPGLLIAIADLVPIPAQLDFAAYYLAAKALLQGQSPYDIEVLRALAKDAGDLPVAAYLYPPSFAALLGPIALLPFPLANNLWFGLNVLWLVLACLCLIQLMPVQRSSVNMLLVFGIALLNPAVQHTLELGQINLLLLLLLCGFFSGLKQPTAARWPNLLGGFCLAIAASLKLFPAILLLVLIVQRRFTTLLGFVGGLLLFLIPGLIAGGGWERLREWAFTILPRYAGGFATPNNQSLEAAIYRLFQPIEVNLFAILGNPAERTLQALWANAELGVALGYGLGALIGLISLWLMMQPSVWRQPDAGQQIGAFLLTLVLLIMPLVWYHYYTLLLLVYAVSLPAMGESRQLRLLMLGGAILIALQRYWRITGQLGTPLMISFGTLGVLLIWFGLAQQLAAQRSATPYSAAASLPES